MKKSNRLLAVLMSLIMIMSLLPGNVLAAEFTSGETDAAAAMEDVTDVPAAKDSAVDTDAAPELTMEEDTGANESAIEDAESDVFSDGTGVVEFVSEADSGQNGESMQNQTSETYVNPLYENVVREADLYQPVRTYSARTLLSDNVDTYTSQEAAGDAIREYLKKREVTFSIGYSLSIHGTDENDVKAQLSPIMHTLFAQAVAHTGNPTEGDYLKWQYAGWTGGYSYSYTSTSEGLSVKSVTYTYNMTYYTTAAQEAELDAALAEVMAELDLSGKSQYEQIKGIYDFICSHVVYDYANLNNADYKLKYTAYAALMHKTSVCQGFATLFYRMALELGIDARLIAGYGGTENHGWNIVELEGYYYNLDSTWDAGLTEYRYFLKNDAEFINHTRWSEYKTADFYASYPMAAASLAAPLCEEHSDWELLVIEKEASCKEEGSGVYKCAVCSATKTQVIEKIEHIPAVLPEKAATCGNSGLTEGSYCAVCGEILVAQEVVPATEEHAWSSWKVTTPATFSAAAERTHSCTNDGCTATETEVYGKKLAVTSKSFPMKVGQSVTIKVTQKTVSDASISWSSSNKKIVKVTANSNGSCKLTAQKKTGTAYITVTLKSGSQVVAKDKIKVTVQSGTVKTTKITAAATAKTMKKGASYKLTTTRTPITSQQAVTYATSNKKVATVSSSGVIKAVGVGKATITAKSGTKTAKCVVTVPGITVKATKATVKVKGSYTWKATLYGISGKATYTSKNTKVAKVSSSGKITGVAPGTTTITVTAGGYSKSCKVTVPGIAGVSKSLTLARKSTKTLAAQKYGTTSALKYKSSNTKVAKVSSSGKITAVAAGTTAITVTAGSYKATCKVTVPGIGNVKSSLTLKKGKTVTLKPTLYGVTADVTYTTSKKSVATVSASGKITAKKKGTAVITVKAGKYSYKCTVTVK